ncbi:hypothetical protein IFM89_027252 [Coptis chinensis]|uniref:MI domain-containing protein n=1 Tax=Coptis chinensis TaxID=261450 RepID=A0A835HFE4_9MAGN|nr:hypothetical protein IFM89_027252 [Coptis chinensis]
MEVKNWEKWRKEKRKLVRAEKQKKRDNSWIKTQKKKSGKIFEEEKNEVFEEESCLKMGKKGKKNKSFYDEWISLTDKSKSEAELGSKEVKEKVKKEEEKEKKKKSLKRKTKGKFEEYLEMDMNKGMVSAEDDLKLERKLAKKLKVKNGKLRGLDDEMNMLFGEVPSILDSAGDEEVMDGEENEDRDEEMYLKKKCKKRKVDVQLEEMENESDEDEEAEAEEDQTDEDEVVEADDEVEKEEPCEMLPELTENVKYIAPHLRARARNESEEHTQIRRHVRGLLNRLSETNVESITEEMSSIYRSIARVTGAQIISEEVLASCSGGPRGNEQYAAGFAAFVAGMACLVGSDFSAKLIASLAKSFEDEFMKEDNLSLRNLTLLLSYLYTFGVCSSDLIYDFLSILSKRLLEIDVSTILTILQCCGMKLRGDDPSSMKDFIFSVQNRVNDLKSPSASMPDDQPKIDNKRVCTFLDSLQMEFMLETIFDIKNNKKRAKDDPAHYTRMKKWLQKLRVEDVILRGLKWSKLLDPNNKGQWWLSGDIASTTDNAEEVAMTIDREPSEAKKFLQLATAQRMNTDARKAIFCVLMGGEDYLDAFEKLLKLDLSGKQDREIMRVLLHCCLQEKVFNNIACGTITKNFDSMELVQSKNLATFTAEMLVSFSLSLAVLKAVDLTDLKQLTPKRVMHFRMLFEAIFKNPEATVWNIFTRIGVTPELEPLRNGLQFFMKQYVVNAGHANKSISNNFKIARKALSSMEGILM